MRRFKFKKPLRFTAVMLCLALSGFFAIKCEKLRSLKDEIIINRGGGDSCDTNFTLQGSKWKGISIVDMETDSVLVEIGTPPYLNCDTCYTLTFLTDTIARMYTFNYNRGELNLNWLGKYGGILDGPYIPGEDRRFEHAFIGDKSYSVNRNELKIIDSVNNSCLLLKPLNIVKP